MADVPNKVSPVVELFGEVAHLTLLSTGCYVGWKLGGSFLAMLGAAAAARVAWFFAWGLFELAVRGGDRSASDTP
jgi:hypothetical protein